MVASPTSTIGTGTRRRTQTIMETVARHIVAIAEHGGPTNVITLRTLMDRAVLVCLKEIYLDKRSEQP